MNKKYSFSRWLILLGENDYSVSRILDDIEIVGAWYKKHYLSSYNIWEVEVPIKIDVIIISLKRKEKNNKVLALDTRIDSLLYFREYLSEKLRLFFF